MNKQKAAWFFGWLVTRKGSGTSGNYGHKGVKNAPWGKGGSAPGGGHVALNIIPEMRPSDVQELIDNYRKQRDQKKPEPEPKPEPIRLTSKGVPTAIEVMDVRAEMFLNSKAGEEWHKADYYERGDLIQRVAERLAGKVPDLPELTAYEMLEQWADTSNDSSIRSLSMQEAAGEVFGIELSNWQKENLAKAQEKVKYGGIGPIATPEVMQKAIRAMYEETQSQLQEAGYKPGDTIRVYRGVVDDPLRDIPDGATVDLEQNVMSSWALSRKIAEDFSGGVKEGVVLGMEVPIESILSTAASGYGTLAEAEIVVLGVPGNQATVLYHGQ